MATVRLTSLLRPLAGGLSSVQASGATLRAVIDDLDRQYPGLRDRIVDAGAIRPDVMLAVGADEVRDLDIPVSADSEVHILPAIAGGGGEVVTAARSDAGPATPKHPRWKFFDYVDEQGLNHVDLGIEALPSSVRQSVRARLDARVQLLQAVKNSLDWRGADRCVIPETA